MEKVDYIICGDYIVTMNEGMDVIKNGAVAIKDKLIIAVGAEDGILRKYDPAVIIKDKYRAVMPGFINTHSHAAMVYFRGLADDLPLKEWLENHIWPAENHWLSSEFVYDATELACLEMLKAGITTHNDMYFFGNSTGLSTKKMGMRAIVGAGILDFPTPSVKTVEDYFSKAEIFINNWKDDDLITPCIAPHSAYTCCPETLKKSKQLSEKYNVSLHIHLSETEWEVNEITSRYGKRPAAHLESVGFLDEKVIAAHCVWLDDRDIEILADRKVGVSHCIESNLKLASGIARVPDMLRAGVKVGFGTDGAASNNNLSIISEMSTSAKLHKAISNDPTVLDSKTAMLMATRLGAEVLGLGSKIGSIEKGKFADIISINLRKPHLIPLYDVYSHIVYSASSCDVETVFVNGKLILNNRKLLSNSEEAILRKASEWGAKIASYNSK